MSDPFYIVNVAISAYGIGLAALGTIGNLLSLNVCLRPSLRKTPTFIFIAFEVCADTVALYFWNFNNFFLTFFGKTMGDMSEDWCRWSLFMQTTSGDISAYLLVCI